jgi:two-component system chemotaxis response regulator CheB
LAADKKINVFIIDTSVTDRSLIETALKKNSNIRITDTAADGNIGLLNIRRSKPDIIVLDTEITDYTLAQFVKNCSFDEYKAGIILTVRHNPSKELVQKVIYALEQGAIDFIEKPTPFIVDEKAIQQLERKLIPKIIVFSIKRYSQLAKIASGRKKTELGVKKIHETILAKTEKLTSKTKSARKENIRLIVIGVSTGGTEALSKLIPKFPQNFPIPIIIVIHIPKAFTRSLAEELDKKSKLKVKETTDGESLRTGIVFIAHGGNHLEVDRGKGGKTILKHNDAPAISGNKPSVDILFKSVAKIFHSNSIAIILTGMGEDGVKGMSILKEKGSLTIAQDESSSIVWGMPGAAVKAGVVDEVIPLNGIAPRIIDILD